MAKKALFNLVRKTSKDVSEMTGLISPRSAGVKAPASRFQSLYKKFPLM
jgi:hypothetical protein